ncbi:MAG: sulfotransferase domain-containing protein [Mycobacterium sp.]
MISMQDQGERFHYHSTMADCLRWDRLPLRDGDIVITAPSKSGMTWTQRLVSLLVFDGPEMPGPLSDISPWLDQTIRPIDQVVATLDAQRHRRFIKTHTPLDGLLLDERVTYLCVGRDPRDAAVSMMFHKNNIDFSRMPEQGAAIGRAAPGFHDWMERPIVTPESMESLAGALHHYGTFWQRRFLPNVWLVHYADLRADLPGELVRLAQVLQIPLTRARADELAGYATLSAMRSRASDLAPNAGDHILLSNEQFFRAGGLGEWQRYFTEPETMRFRHRIHELRPPRDMLAWAQFGRRGCDPTGPGFY